MKPKLDSRSVCWCHHKKVHKKRGFLLKKHTFLMSNAEYSFYSTQLLSLFTTCCISLSNTELVYPIEITQKFFSQLIFFSSMLFLLLNSFYVSWKKKYCIFSYLVPSTFVITECSQSFFCSCCSLFQKGYSSYAFFGKFRNCFSIIFSQWFTLEHDCM